MISFTSHRMMDGRRRIAFWLFGTELFGFAIGKERPASLVDTSLSPCCQQLAASFGTAAATGMQVRCRTCREILELTRRGWSRRSY
jgi:hypothetical protein